MNAKQHVHELEFYHNYYRDYEILMLKPDPEKASSVKYGDQSRDWPQLKQFEKKPGLHWWSRRERRSPEEARELLEKARTEVIQEMIVTHDLESIKAGEQDQIRQDNLQQYVEVAQSTTGKAWQRGVR